MLGPTDRVDDRARPFPARVLAEGLGNLEELLLRAPADAGDELGRVTAEVLPQELEDAAWVLEGRVLLRRLAVDELAGLRAVP